MRGLQRVQFRKNAFAKIVCRCNSARRKKGNAMTDDLEIPDFLKRDKNDDLLWHVANVGGARGYDNSAMKKNARVMAEREAKAKRRKERTKKRKAAALRKEEKRKVKERILVLLQRHGRMTFGQLRKALPENVCDTHIKSALRALRKNTIVCAGRWYLLKRVNLTELSGVLPSK